MFKFLGGIHPDDGKSLSREQAIEIMPLSKELVVPLSQHIGAPCKPLVKAGDIVKKGQLIGDHEAFMNAKVHAPTSGKVTKVEMRPHSGMNEALSVVIEPDGADEWADGLPLNRDYTKMSKEEIVKAIGDAGIVGMGGATFPAHIKLTPKKNIDTLIINGAECEPYLTADDRLMREDAARIVEGANILAKMLETDKNVIAMEDNKAEAYETMKKAAEGTNIEVVKLPTRYPQGAEKMLIYVITGREVPAGGLPMDVAAVVQNVGTAAAVADAVEKGLPLIERVTAVTGDAIENPKNLRVRIGTKYKDAIDFCGGFKETPSKVIAGGPMMGFAQHNLEVPIMKGSSGILALTAKITAHEAERPCIRCGRCVDACPMGLVPSMLSIYGQRGNFAASRDEYGVMNCIECGSCTYVCPAKRNIVQYIRHTKGELRRIAAVEKAKQEAKAKGEQEKTEKGGNDNSGK